VCLSRVNGRPFLHERDDDRVVGVAQHVQTHHMAESEERVEYVDGTHLVGLLVPGVHEEQPHLVEREHLQNGLVFYFR